MTLVALLLLASSTACDGGIEEAKRSLVSEEATVRAEAVQKTGASPSRSTVRVTV